MARSKNEQAAFGYIVLFCMGIILLYILSKFLLILGIIMLIGGFIFLMVGLHQNEEQLNLIGIILMVMGFMAFILGLAGVNFFENNSVGSDLLETSESVIDSAAEAYNAAQETKTAVSDAEREAINQLSQEIG